MKGAETLRPGLVNGYYPQRADARRGWLDSVAADVTGHMRQLKSPATASGQFVEAVNGMASGLRRESDNALKARIAALQQALLGSGFRDGLLVESFAIIREVSRRLTGKSHHDVQIAGGLAMLNGKLAEMETGEGKTLTALLPACTAALSGVPVHVITVNDFLVLRDARELEPIYAYMGLEVGTITEELDLPQRRKAYRADVTYCTNKQLAFDYLKDTLLLDEESRPLHLQLEGLYQEVPKTDRLLMRGLCFAIVDEADSVLIDEAKTPLVISRQGEPGEEAPMYHQAVGIARSLVQPQDFELDTKLKRVRLTPEGEGRIAELAQTFGGIWNGSKRRRELVTQALTALHAYQVNVNYLVADNAISIIDEYTGRLMPDRSWEGGLHQMIEAKEDCPITGRQETLARISYQRFFRRYLRLCGMTGTAREIAPELWSVYGLGVERIATHRPLRRTVCKDQCTVTAAEKWNAVLTAARTVQECGRPVLIGTRTVADSEIVSEALSRAGLGHVVLNARDAAEEAAIVAQAGQAGRITVATNMAGRGTDIRLGAGVSEQGGLHVLSTCFHEARRIDRQLFGRCGRQGDCGSYQTIVSLEDEIFELYLPPWIKAVLVRFFDDRGVLPPRLLPLLRWAVQRRAEARHARIRRDMMRLDENLSDMLAFSGRPE